MNIFQILISDEETSSNFPSYLAHSIRTIREAFPAANHKIYSGAELREFISSNFDADTLGAYDKLVPYAYKADLGRYCLLYKLGGWYFDIGARVNLKFDAHVDAVVFCDLTQYSQTSWACSNSVLFSRALNPIYQEAISIVIRHCKEEYYGIGPLCPTGPNVLGQAFAKFGANPRFIVGTAMKLTPQHSNQNQAYVLPDGSIFAFHKPTGPGDLSRLGIGGTNNYIELYRSRAIYRRT